MVWISFIYTYLEVFGRVPSFYTENKYLKFRNNYCFRLLAHILFYNRVVCVLVFTYYFTDIKIDITRKQKTKLQRHLGTSM